MAVDEREYQEAKRAVTLDKIRAQQMHDLSIIAAGVSQNTPTAGVFHPAAVAERALKIYKALREAAERDL